MVLNILFDFKQQYLLTQIEVEDKGMIIEKIPSFFQWYFIGFLIHYESKDIKIWNLIVHD